jgi:hypothetical protein
MEALRTQEGTAEATRELADLRDDIGRALRRARRNR